MVNLLKSISIFCFIFVQSIVTYGQNWKIGVDIPVVSHQIASLNELDNGFSEYWSSERYIPNFRFISSYKEFIIGFELYFNYSANKYRNTYNKLKDGDIEGIYIQSYSLLLGYKKSFERFQIYGGVGLTYNEEEFATYKDYEINLWESAFCKEENNWGPMIWTSLKYDVFKGINIGLNFRFNPMLRPFHPNKNWPCFTPHNHDRIHYFVSQLTVGYEF